MDLGHFGVGRRKGMASAGAAEQSELPAERGCEWGPRPGRRSSGQASQGPLSCEEFPRAPQEALTLDQCWQDKTNPAQRKA